MQTEQEGITYSIIPTMYVNAWPKLRNPELLTKPFILLPLSGDEKNGCEFIKSNPMKEPIEEID
jgi:hypothetical protein